VEVVKRKLVIVGVIISLLTCLVATALWARSIRTADEIYLPTMGGTVWRLHSGDGVGEVGRYGRWPAEGRFVHVSHGADPAHLVTPVFGVRNTGARRKEWEWREFYFAKGTVRVVLSQDGKVEFGRPAIAVFQAFSSQKFSPLIPFWSCSVPLWFVIGLCAAFPAVVAGRAFMRHARQSAKEPVGHWG
jgi:hypothetical protein